MTSSHLVRLSELAAPKGLVGGPFGSSLGKKDYVAAGIPVIRGQNLSGDSRFDATDFVFVSEEKAASLARNQAQPGDVVFTQRGTLGQVGLVPGDFDRYVISQSQMRLRVDPEKADARYVYYCFRNPAIIELIKSRAIVTGVPHINLGILADLPVPFHRLRDQQAIAEVLGALDDKIEANERLVRFCDELWLTLTARALGEATVSGSTAPLTSMARFVNGRAFTKGATGTGRMVVRIAELNSGPGGSTVYNDLDVPELHLARPGDLLFAWSGSLTVQRWFRDEAIINQHIFKVIPETGVPIWLVHAHLLRLLDGFRAIAADKATTMGHIQRRHLEVPVPVLAKSALTELSGRCGPLWQRALVAERESLTLAALRDTLLPPLVSGRLRVREAESLVGEAV